MRLSVIFGVLILLLTPLSAGAADIARVSVPNARIVGDGVLTYAFWDIYRASLFAPDGRWSQDKPFALSIEYFRSIEGRAIADRSVQEMRRQGISDEVKLAAWHAQMRSIFPNVENGTVLSAIYNPGKDTAFYKGNDKIGVIKGDDFARSFFGIWLDERTSAPELRRALLGGR